MTHNSRLAQRGMTLIGAMVGLVVSMLIVLTLMSAYRSVVHLTVESNANAQQSGDLSAAFLFAHLNLSDAGRGLTDPARETDLRLFRCDGPSLDAETGTLSGCDEEVTNTDPEAEESDREGHAIFWRWRSGAAAPVSCAGFLAFPDTDPDRRGRLDYLEPQQICDPGFPMEGWSSAITLVQPSPTNRDEEDPNEENEANEDDRSISFSFEDLAPCGDEPDEPPCCRPLGVSPGSIIQGRIQVTIRSRHVGSNTDLRSTTCLVNLPQ
jgi:hypothetical protein